jgi:hypothetical protein
LAAEMLQDRADIKAPGRKDRSETTGERGQKLEWMKLWCQGDGYV